MKKGFLRKALELTVISLSLAFSFSAVNVLAEENVAKEEKVVEEKEYVTFSKESGAYDDAFELTLTGNYKNIYYTLDGSDPRTSATRITYKSAIKVVDRVGEANIVSAVDPSLFDSANVTWDKEAGVFVSKREAPSDEAVDKATVIRAVGEKDGKFTEVSTNTYFVGSMADHVKGVKESANAAGVGLSIMSIVMDSEDLFDYEKGIYVHGKIFDDALAEYLKENSVGSWNAVDIARGMDANYKQRGREWERECHIDYFESDGTDTQCLLQQDCGIRVQGNYSRSDLLKGLRLYARSDYGEKNFKYAFFGEDNKDILGETIKKYKKLTLRNGGNCAFSAKFNDAFWQSLMDDLDVSTQKSRACVVYINGEYWGLYVLQEDYNQDSIEEKYKVDGKDVIIYKGDAEALELGYKLDDGELPEGETFEGYYLNYLYDFLLSREDLTDPSDFDEFCTVVDPDSIRDYFAINCWLNNKWDWPGKNWSAWKTVNFDIANEYSDSRYRLAMYDLDFGGVSGSSDAYTNTIKEDNYMTYGLLDRETENPMVLAFAYLMTNEVFRNDFYDKLNSLSENQFEKTRALNKLEEFENIYGPLYDQFFDRYPGSGSKNDALNGGYSSSKCIRDFINKRAENIQKQIDWSESYFARLKLRDLELKKTKGTVKVKVKKKAKAVVKILNCDPSYISSSNCFADVDDKEIVEVKSITQKGKKIVVKFKAIKKGKTTLNVSVEGRVEHIKLRCA